MQATLPRHEIVLLGIGHTNAHVLRMWRMDPIPDARLTCVSNFSVATYSGMLPGALAGQYPRQRMEIDLVRLCAANGARLIVDEVTGIDLNQHSLQFAERPALPFDALSIGIGSIQDYGGVVLEGDLLLAIKPMQTFLDRLTQRLEQLHTSLADRALRVVIVGAGAGGVEITFCLPGHVRQILGEQVELSLTVVQAGQEILLGAGQGMVRAARRELERRGVQLHRGRRVVKVSTTGVALDDGSEVPADIVLWATRATAPPLLSELGLPTDDRGFLLTNDTLRTTTDHPVFAVGDSGTIAGQSTPKAGVYAVRQGKILWRNLRRQLENRPLTRFVPQRGFLKLLNLGDGRAILEHRGLTATGRWCWWLKDAIDGRFMDKYQDYKPMTMDEASAPAAPAPMRCAGCGGKVAGSVLSRVLDRLDVPPSEHVLLGLDAPDDAAIVQTPGGRPVTVTVDFFAAPLDDPYLVGRIAALNAASDVFALGANPLAALAMATIPLGRPRAQEQLLYELLAGSLAEFRRMGTTLVGGHTIEGPQLALGFTVLADQGTAAPLIKGNLQLGDRLVLTKPLGTGTLLAAHMQAECQAPWMDLLLRSMVLSNQPASTLVEQCEIRGLTDVTGFGLAGHLLEMLRPSGRAAELRLDDLPLLDGFVELTQAGIESTLAPANREAETAIGVNEALRSSPQYAALFDPQTSGGLLLGVPERHVDACLDQLRQQSDVPAAVIGSVVEAEGAEALVLLE